MTISTELVKQFAKYFGVALIGYAFDFGTLIFLTSFLHVYYLVGATAGFTIGLVVVYVLSNRYVFGQSKLKSRAREFLLFALIGLIGLGILNGLMWLLTTGLAVHYIVSKIVATVVVYGWNFGARRTMYHD